MADPNTRALVAKLTAIAARDLADRTITPGEAADLLAALASAPDAAPDDTKMESLNHRPDAANSKLTPSNAKNLDAARPEAPLMVKKATRQRVPDPDAALGLPPGTFGSAAPDAAHDENCWIACPHEQPPVPDAARQAEALRAALTRAVRVAENLHGMIDRETWRATGGDDGQGHYEGDYHAEQIRDEIDGWKRLLAAAGDTSEEPTR